MAHSRTESMRTADPKEAFARSAYGHSDERHKRPMVAESRWSASEMVTWKCGRTAPDPTQPPGPPFAFLQSGCSSATLQVRLGGG